MEPALLIVQAVGGVRVWTPNSAILNDPERYISENSIQSHPFPVHSSLASGFVLTLLGALSKNSVPPGCPLFLVPKLPDS